MTHLNHRIHLRRERGQTLVIAMLVLGVLLVLGLVFISLIGRNVKSTDRLGQRSVANDLAEAGIRYAHEQLYRGQLGADWRGTPTSLYAATDTAHTNPFTRDPDALYLRGPARDGGGNPLAFVVGSNQPDLGGPDGLGPFIRVSFNNGRALLRVRYAPSDANMFSASIEGSLRNPKAVRSYLIIESVGRPGRLDPNDPTLLLTPTPVQFDQFASTAALRQAVNTWQANETKISTSRPLRAFASIGLIDTARFISNKYNVSSPARLGIAPELGVTYSGVAVGSRLGLQVGTSLNVPAFRQTLTPSATLIPGFGSMQVNGDLRLYGRMDVALNRALGDVLSVSGTISGENGSTLNLTSQDIDNSGNWQAAQLTALTPAGNPSFDSRSNTFSTFHGVLRDGVASADTEGFPRGNGRKVPPSILTTDADTGASRYVLQTRESGVLVAGGNSGRFGYGQGAYIDNISDLQIPSTESGRQAVGAQQSLIEEWLNPIPKRTADRSFWVGPYYIPPGAFVQLLPDGFIITRNGAAPAGERTWKLPNGADSGSTSIRYRIGLAGGQRYIINSLTSADIQSASPNFANGMPFNGVIYAEGNIRIRGVIPTDVQLTVVSRGSM